MNEQKSKDKARAISKRKKQHEKGAHRHHAHGRSAHEGPDLPNDFPERLSNTTQKSGGVNAAGIDFVCH